jgi:hypothetical protein
MKPLCMGKHDANIYIHASILPFFISGLSNSVMEWVLYGYRYILICTYLSIIYLYNSLDMRNEMILSIIMISIVGSQSVRLVGKKKSGKF